MDPCAHLRQTAADPGRIELRIDSDPAQIAGVRRAVEQFAAHAGFSEDAQGQIGLCVNEALANVVRHAYGGALSRPIVVAVEDVDAKDEERSRALRVTIRDWGSGVDPATLPPKPHDPLKPGGVGLVCLRRLMDEVTFAPQKDGMLLTMVKRRT